MTLKKQIYHDLLLKERVKLHQVSTSFPILKFTSRSFKSSSGGLMMDCQTL